MISTAPARNIRSFSTNVISEIYTSSPGAVKYSARIKAAEVHIISLTERISFFAPHFFMKSSSI